jgi:hypothetical protein
LDAWKASIDSTYTPSSRSPETCAAYSAVW